MSHRVAFYPCCSTDFEQPLELLRDFADEVVFCDISRSLLRASRQFEARIRDGLPKASFLTADARTVVEAIEKIDVLFYRRDSAGEGGSSIFVLGDPYLRKVLSRFPVRGGHVITDGSNSRGDNFGRMIRQSGLTKYGWRFRKADEQPFLADHGLYVISVLPNEQASDV